MRKIQIAAEETDGGWGVGRRIEGDYSILQAAQGLAILAATLETLADDLDKKFSLPRGSMITRATELLTTVEVKHSMMADRSKPKG